MATATREQLPAPKVAGNIKIERAVGCMATTCQCFPPAFSEAKPQGVMTSVALAVVSRVFQTESRRDGSVATDRVAPSLRTLAAEEELSLITDRLVARLVSPTNRVGRETPQALHRPITAFLPLKLRLKVL